MPTAQFLDLNPSPRTEYTPLEQTLQGFSKRQRENQIDDQETDALRDIYGQYQKDGQNLEKMIMDIQTRPGISPTSRVNTVKQLLDFQTHNGNLQKKAKEDAEKRDKEQSNKNIIADLERRRNLTTGSLAAYESNPQMAEQITRPSKDSVFNKAEHDRNEERLRKAGATDKQIELYNASPVGGQTKVIGDILEELSRNKTPPGLSSPEVQDYDSGLTPGERVKRQDDRFKLQTPIVNENSKSLASLETESLSLDLLDELSDSENIKQGIHALNINPKTGDLFLPAAATPEEQLFVKTVNDFTVKAKDSFGARVTNFELDRFMQRLPTLANSAEGRKLIIRQMKIVNEINQLEKKGIQEVFDKYGIRNIDYADAENMARTKISPQKEELRKEYLNLEHLAKKEDDELIQNIKSKVKEGYEALRTPEGKIKQFPKKNIQNMLDSGKGYKKI